MGNEDTTASTKEQAEGLSDPLEQFMTEEHFRHVPEAALEATARLTAVASEKTLAKIWDTPEENAAWTHL